MVLRNPKAMNSAKNQVMFALNDYLAGIALDQLSNQAAVGGISFSTNANNGLMLNANGFTQRLPQLLKALMEGYSSFTPTEDSWRRPNPGIWIRWILPRRARRLIWRFCRCKCCRRFLISSVKRAASCCSPITLKDVLAYRDALKTNTRPEFLIVGNMVGGSGAKRWA